MIKILIINFIIIGYYLIKCIFINSKFYKMKSSMINRLKIKESDPSEEKGIIYVGHLPHGFVEDGLKEYFS